MDERTQFTFYKSYWDAIEELPAKAQLPILKAIIRYALFGEEPASLTPVCRAVFLLVKPTLDASRKKAANGKQGGSKPKAKGKQTQREGEKEEEIEKENEIEGENEKKQDPPNDGSLFTAFWNAYPETAKRRREAAWNAWKKLNPTPAEAARIMDHLAAWKASKRWLDDGGEYIPNAENFLDPDKGYMKNKPAPAKQAVPKGASGELGAAEMEAIQRVLRENPPVESGE